MLFNDLLKHFMTSIKDNDPVNHIGELDIVRPFCVVKFDN